MPATLSSDRPADVGRATRYANHDPIAEAAWVADHEYIARTVARRRARFAGRDDLIDDYRQVGRLALVEAYRRIDHDAVDAVDAMTGDANGKTTATAYAWTAVWRRTARLWEAERRAGRGEGCDGGDNDGDDMNETWDIEDEGRSAVARIEDEDTVEYAVKGLTDNEKDVVICYFDLDSHGALTVATLARRGNTSQATVYRTIRRAIDKMRAMVDADERKSGTKGVEG